MIKEEYQVIREKVKPLQMLGNISEEEVLAVTLLYQEADINHSLTMLFKALQATFQKDLDAEKGVVK